MALTDARSLTLPDGRTLAYAVYGVADAALAPPTVLYFHGFPGSRHEAALFHRTALQHGVRIVAPDRPGMGQSTFHADRRILDWPQDVAFLADQLGIREFAVIGTSAGAPYALACRRAFPPSRLRGVGLVGGLYPVEFGLQGMMLGARVLLWIAPWATGLVQTALDWNMGVAARDKEHPEALAELLAQGFAGRPHVDRKIWEQDVGGFSDNLIASTREALRESAQGPAWESRLFGSPWGFGLDELQLEEGRFVMWHGGLDVNSPLRMAKKAHGLLLHSDLRVSPEEGHCSLAVHKADEIISTLKGMVVEARAA
ncbi:hypothetical protein SLS56_002634 [Neofusicoccum ribis]|uniref:AB hydrolase-1 domain-containing protein n=1 Tax=Neofusicoccum ribis TaxID=45134 RepID=A0ABR3T3Y8_9PEZI